MSNNSQIKSNHAFIHLNPSEQTKFLGYISVIASQFHLLLWNHLTGMTL